MAVIGVLELANGHSASVDQKGNRKYTRTFLVEVNSLSDGGIVATSAGIPSKYSSYITPNESDLGATVRDITATQRTDNMYLWEIKCEYSSMPFEAKDKQGQPSDSNNNKQDASLRPWEWKVKSKKVDRIVTTDTHNTPILNSAGVPFENPLTVPSSNFLISVTAFRSSLAFYPDIAYWCDSVNTTVWQGFSSFSLRVEDIDVSSKYDNNQFYWTKTVTVEYKPDGWHPFKVLDCSTVEKYEAPPGSGNWKLRNIQDAHGQPITSAVPMDGHGTKLGFGLAPIYLSYYPYYEKDFTNLI